jgi:hypothetical protein
LNNQQLNTMANNSTTRLEPLSLELTLALKKRIDEIFGGLIQLEQIRDYEDFMNGLTPTISHGVFEIKRIPETLKRQEHIEIKPDPKKLIINIPILC